MATFHVEICREGPFWRLHVVEIDRSSRVSRRAEINETATRLVLTHTQALDGEVDLIVRTERDSVRLMAEGLGFRNQVRTAGRTDCFCRGDKTVRVRYDSYDCVVDVDASHELKPFLPTREGAIDALKFGPA